MSLRKRIANSERLNRAVASLFSGYIRFVHRSSSWQRIGFEPLEATLRDGKPVIIVLWHQRLALSPYFFPLELGDICSITSSARAGSMVGLIQKQFGFHTIAMSSHKRHVTLSREVLRQIKKGMSIGIAADGPRGPERICSSVPIIWARTSGLRVFVVSYSVRKAREAGSWDRMFLPAPWNEGAFVCREWDKTVPRRASEEEIETLRLDLQSTLNAVSAECDEMVGRAPWEAPVDQV